LKRYILKLEESNDCMKTYVMPRLKNFTILFSYRWYAD